MLNSSPMKFISIQCIIGKHFLGNQFALKVPNSQVLGSLIPSSPASITGGSEVDSYKFSLLLLQMVQLLLRAGFYHSEGLLLQAIHIAYGILHSHVYMRKENINRSLDASSVIPLATNPTSNDKYVSLPSEEPAFDRSEDASTAEIEMTQPVTDSLQPSQVERSVFFLLVMSLRRFGKGSAI